jgi:hypothetical protein
MNLGFYVRIQIHMHTSAFFGFGALLSDSRAAFLVPFR